MYAQFFNWVVTIFEPLLKNDIEGLKLDGLYKVVYSIVVAFTLDNDTMGSVFGAKNKGSLGK